MRKKALLCLLMALVCCGIFAQIGADTPRWGQISLCCAHLRVKPAHSSELSTQALMGTPVKILGQEKEWYHIQTPDGYESRVHQASLSLKSAQEMAQWRRAHRYVYTAFQGFIYEAPELSSQPVSDIVSGCIVQAFGKAKGKFFPVLLPDGRKGYVKRNEVQEFKEWAETPPDINEMLKVGRQMMGTTYLWGGTSVKGADCSGFTRIVYFSGGILLLRDASQQAKTGRQIAAEDWKNCCTGDLLFFCNDAGRVNHVGIYLQDGEFIHSSGSVKMGSLHKDSPFYHPQRLFSISRILSRLDTPGIVSVRRHAWYF